MSCDMVGKGRGLSLVEDGGVDDGWVMGGWMDEWQIEG